MNGIETLLSRLQKVRRKGKSWTACCPAHEDKSPSLAIRENDDGRVLIHCFGGCDTYSIVSAVGMDIQDLFPAKIENHMKPVKQAFYAADLMRIMSFESLVVMISAYDLRKGRKLRDDDMARLELAQSRIQEIVRYANV